MRITLVFILILFSIGSVFSRAQEKPQIKPDKALALAKEAFEKEVKAKGDSLRYSTTFWVYAHQEMDSSLFSFPMVDSETKAEMKESFPSLSPSLYEVLFLRTLPQKEDIRQPTVMDGMVWIYDDSTKNPLEEAKVIVFPQPVPTDTNYYLRKTIEKVMADTGRTISQAQLVSGIRYTFLNSSITWKITDNKNQTWYYLQPGILLNSVDFQKKSDKVIQGLKLMMEGIMEELMPSTESPKADTLKEPSEKEKEKK